jgi:hypothetical protein
VQQLNCDSGAALGLASAATGALSYHANLNRYTFQWETDKSWAGTWRQLSLALRDETVHPATFKLVK